jgi:branched-chain amino acid aminotransferase
VGIEPSKEIWMDGEWVPWEDANVHVLTHGLHYGTGVFDGMRAYATARGPAIFRLQEHVDRLFRSAHIYGMTIPFTASEIADVCRAAVARSGMSAGYIRPLVYRGAGDMGLVLRDIPVRVSVSMWGWGTYLGDDAVKFGARVRVSSWRRHDPNIVPVAAKGTGPYINSALAKSEALAAGYDEAVMLNSNGFVAEGSGENIFVVRNGAVSTPPESAGILPGITRQSVMTILADLGYEIVERDLLRTDLYVADEIFFTGTGAEITPVREVDDRVVGTGAVGEVTRCVQENYFKIVSGQVDKYFPWLEFISQD